MPSMLDLLGGEKTKVEMTQSENKSMLDLLEPEQKVEQPKSSPPKPSRTQTKLDSFEPTLPFMLPFMHEEEKKLPKSNVEELRTAPEQSLIDKVKSWWINPREDRAKSDNILALHKSTGLPIADVRRNYEALSRAAFPGSVPDSSVERVKYIGSKGMEAGIVAGLVTHPVVTATALGTFFGLDEVENAIISNMKEEEYKFGGGKGLSDLLNAEGLSADSLDLLDFLWKIPAAGVAGKVSSNLMANVVRSMPEVKSKINFVNNIARKVKETGKNPDDIVVEDVADFGIDPKVIEETKLKVEEVKRRQDELEVERLAKSKLAEQGRNVEEVKQRIVDENEGFVPESEFVENSMMELIKQEGVSKGGKEKVEQTETKTEGGVLVKDNIEPKVEEPTKLDVNFIGMQQRLRGDPLPLVNEPSGTTVAYKPEKHNIVNIDDYNKAIAPKEPITDVDLRTGTPEPVELSTDKSPFRDTPENTQTLKKLYEERKKSIEGDPELITSKLINDVNRWLDGDDSIPINEVKNTLSEFATRANQLRGVFANEANFVGWRKTIGEAAKWARGADRLKNERTGPKLYSGIDPTLLKPFFSKVKEVVESVKFGKISHGDLVRMLKGKGATADEIEATLGGLKDRKGTISKEEVLEEVRANGTEFEDVVLGGIKGNTQYGSYVESGAVEGSYRELFVTAPDKKFKSDLLGLTLDSPLWNKYTDKDGFKKEYNQGDTITQDVVDFIYRLDMNKVNTKEKGWTDVKSLSTWKDGHDAYSDIQNPIVRIRYNERDVNGKRILFVEEIQGPSETNQQLMPEYLRKRIYDIGVKRVIALAKEEGFDGVSWTTGKMQADRYDLSKQISKVEYNDNSSGGIGQADLEGVPSSGILRAYDLNHKMVIEEYITDPIKQLSDYIGKEAAQKLLIQKPTRINDAGINSRHREIEGLDLQVGGEGLKRLYDETIPGLMKKYGKGEVKIVDIDTKDFKGYRYEGPTRTVEEVKKLVSFDQPTAIYEAARSVSNAMDRGAPFEEAIVRQGNPSLAYKLGGELFDIQGKQKVQSIDINEKTPSTFSMYSGIPLDEAAKVIVEGAKRLSEYTKKARGMKELKLPVAIQRSREELNKALLDRSGNIRKELLDNLGNDGYEVVQKMVLAKGASSRSANALRQMQKEVYDGLSKNEKRILDNLILADRMIDIGKYKTEAQFKFPEGLKPTEAAAYSELFGYIEKVDEATVSKLRNKAAAYYEWMKKPLKDMYESGLISEKEYNDLISHNYRRLKLVEVFDKRYEVKIGNKKRSVYDSGVESLQRGRDTDVFEPSSEIMALEVFNRAYGRIMNNEANKSLLDLARRDKENPFVRIKEEKGDKIPEGWNRIFVYENGERKSLYISPSMSKEWITSNPDISYRIGQVLRYASGSPILRTFATGIDWGFALANLPRDIMHAWFSARTFENGKWKSVYNPNLPLFSWEMTRDLISVFNDAVLRKGRYEDYIKEGGGMEFLVHQGRLLQRGRHLEGPVDKVFDWLGYFGETSELLTRLAIRERVMRQGKSSQEATFAARDYMDFSQGGWLTKSADNALPYLNAAIQGTRGIFRSFKDNPLESSYKLAQFAAAVTGIYIANNALNPKTMQSLKGSQDAQNNLIIPLGDSFGFQDEKGQTRYPYVKIPIDPGQKFFKAFFEGTSDKWLGNEVDVDRLTGSLTALSPVSTSTLPPTLSGTLGYVMNKDFWLNEDIWRKTDKPFSWPASKEEFIPGKTPEAFVDLGSMTGMSPERTKYAVEQLVTGNSMWSYFAGKGYETLFGDMPQEQREQHLAESLSKFPVVKRFFGITNPYSQFSKTIESEKESSVVNRWIENRGLDALAEGYLHKGNVKRGEVVSYISSFKDRDTFKRLKDRFEFQEKIKELPNRSFWLSLKGISDTEARAKVYLERLNKATPDERQQLMNEVAIVSHAGGVISDEFRKEVMKLKGGQ